MKAFEYPTPGEIAARKFSEYKNECIKIHQKQFDSYILSDGVEPGETIKINIGNTYYSYCDKYQLVLDAFADQLRQNCWQDVIVEIENKPVEEHRFTWLQKSGYRPPSYWKSECPSVIVQAKRPLI